MKNLPDNLSIALHPGQVVSLKSERGHVLTVHVAAGPALWVTRNGDDKDYWLGASETFPIRAGDEITLSVERGDGAVVLSVAAVALAASRGAEHRIAHGLGALPALVRRLAARLAALPAP